MLECDYPHSDSTWPETRSCQAHKWLGHLPDDVQHKIAIGNAIPRSTTSRPADPATIGPS